MILNKHHYTYIAHIITVNLSRENPISEMLNVSDMHHASYCHN